MTRETFYFPSLRRGKIPIACQPTKFWILPINIILHVAAFYFHTGIDNSHPLVTEEDNCWLLGTLCALWLTYILPLWIHWWLMNPAPEKQTFLIKFSPIRYSRLRFRTAHVNISIRIRYSQRCRSLLSLLPPSLVMISISHAFNEDLLQPLNSSFIFCRGHFQ